MRTRSTRDVRWRGVRARSTVAAVLVVAVALVAGAAALVFVLDRSLAGAARDDATTRLTQVSRIVERDGVAAARRDALQNTPEGLLVQVVDGDGRVLVASGPRATERPLTRLDPAVGETASSMPGTTRLFDLDDRYEFLVRTVDRGDGEPVRVVVASSLKQQREAVETVLWLLAAGAPLLLAVVARATWVVVGRALAPVESIRTRVAEIGSQHLADRVPVPTTGDEIARLAVTMNDMLARLERAQDAQRRFVSDASHELRSPLSTLSVTVDVGPGADDPTGARTRAVLAGEVSRMSALVDNLLLLAKADEGLPLQVVDVDLDDLVLDEVRRLGADARVRVEREVSPARVPGDAVRLAQVLRNLVDNAVRHGRGRVRLGCRTTGDEAELWVDDDGPGIPEVDRDRVFERFVRVGGSRERGDGGSGLGLAIVAEIVAAHAGTVRVGESAWGGCRVLVRLPAVTLES